jgi:hypothetical protein
LGIITIFLKEGSGIKPGTVQFGVRQFSVYLVFWFCFLPVVRRPSKALSAAFQRFSALSDSPGGVKTHDRQIDAFERGLLGEEVSVGVHSPPDARVDALNGIGRADDGADLTVELQEGHEFGPGVRPEPDDRQVALFPSSLNSTNRSSAPDSDAAV